MWRPRAHGGSSALALHNEEQRAPGIRVPSALILILFSYMYTWAFRSRAPLLPSLHTWLKQNFFSCILPKEMTQDLKITAECHNLYVAVVRDTIRCHKPSLSIYSLSVHAQQGPKDIFMGSSGG